MTRIDACIILAQRQPDLDGALPAAETSSLVYLKPLRSVVNRIGLITASDFSSISRSISSLWVQSTRQKVTIVATFSIFSARHEPPKRLRGHSDPVRVKVELNGAWKPAYGKIAESRRWTRRSNLAVGHCCFLGAHQAVPDKQVLFGRTEGAGLAERV